MSETTYRGHTIELTPLAGFYWVTVKKDGKHVYSNNDCRHIEGARFLGKAAVDSIMASVEEK